MKNNLRRLLSLLLCITLCFSAGICHLGIFAYPMSESVNVLSGVIPTAFMAAADGGTTRIDGLRGPSWDWLDNGYDRTRTSDTYISEDRYDALKDHVIKLTDGDETTHTAVAAKNKANDVLISFEIGKSDITGFYLSNGDSVFASSIDFYASDSYDTLFSSLITTVTTSAGKANGTVSVTGAKYVAFRLNGADGNMKEIAVYGTPSSEEPVNVLSGVIPTAFMAVADGGTARINGLRGPSWDWLDNGYDRTRTDDSYISEDRYDALKDHVIKLTDGDETTHTAVAAKNKANDVLISFEIGKSDITGFYLSNGDSVFASGIDFYASDSYDTLFSSLITTVTPSDGKANGTVSVTGAKYVAFRLNGADGNMKEIAVYGTPSAAETNLISGITPTAFMAVADGGTTRINGLRGPTWDYADNGYDRTRTDDSYISEDRYNALKDHVIKLTDGDETTSTPAAAKDKTNNDVLISFEIGKSDITGFYLSNSDSVFASSIDFYASDSYDTLFSSLITTVTPSDGKANGTVSVTGAKYVAFRLNGADGGMKEIAVYGNNSDESDEEPVYENSLISGMLPSAFYTASAGGTGYSWHDLSAAGGNLKGYDCYNSRDDVSTTFFNNWQDKVKLFTDGKADKELLVKPEKNYANHGGTYEDVLVMFELNEKSNLSGLEIYIAPVSEDYPSFASVDVYLSNDQSTVFSQTPVSATVTDNKITSELSAEGVKFVGFRLKESDCYIKEILIFGEAMTEEPIDAESNLINGTLPTKFYTASAGGTGYSWHDLSATGGNLKGYDCYNSRDDVSTTFFNNWQDKVKLFTDGKADKELLVKPEKNYANHGGTYEDVLIVYEFSETASLTGFEIRSSVTNNTYPSFSGVDVYISKNREYLFAQEPVSATEENGKYTGTLSGDGILYIGFRLKESDCLIKEILVYGEFKEYVRPDYGTNLIAGKLPMSVFIAEREYPLPHTADRIYKLMEDKERTTTLEMLTDGDFSKAFSWYHDHSYQKVNKDSRYKVLAYDLGSVSKIEKILIDGKCGGYDIFVSDDYNNLYNPDQTRVYTSGGDKLLPDGSALDPSTDLIPGENLIELSGVSGRYVGIVITRGSRLDKSDNESVEITEIQIFGKAGNSEFGDNLIKGKLPIFNYRAKYGKYDTSLGESFVEEPGASVFTDGNLKNITEMIMPNNGGLLSYDYGANVMIYYLEGKCDINAFALHSQYYYAPGGLDLYVSDTFANLFDAESRVFTTGGETAEDKVYDVTKDLGAVSISASLKTPKSGRYVAFVITRFYDSQIAGWGQLQMRELELFGTMKETEVLPSTTLTDKKTGATATFIYKNPDDNFKFAAKNINSFGLKTVSEKEYATDTFKQALRENNYKIIGDAFYLEFFDKNGKEITLSSLRDEELYLVFKFDNNDFKRLAEIRDGSIYPVKQAEQRGSTVALKTDEFNRLFVFVTFISSDSTLSMGNGDLGVIDVQTYVTDRKTNNDNTGTNDSYQFDNGDFTEFDSEILDEQDNYKDNSGKPAKKRRWVTVGVDDPFEWFWNIFDTFAANIWMLFACVATLLLCVGAVILEIVLIKKRRMQQ